MMQRLSSMLNDDSSRSLKVSEPVGQDVTQRPQLMQSASWRASLYGVSTLMVKPRPVKS